MALFDKLRKKNNPPAAAPPPDPEPQPVDAPPYRMMYLDSAGIWRANPNYDPAAKAPEEPKVLGFEVEGDDEDEED